VLAAGPAQGSAPSPAESLQGDFSYPPFTIQVSAQRAAGAPATAATGSFTGTLSLGKSTAGEFMGPVTCLDVVGNSAGLFYPVKKSSPALVAAIPLGVLVTVTRTSTGQPLGVTFVPVPETHVKSCAPMTPTVFPITSGTLTFTPGIASSATTPATTLEIADAARLGHAGTQRANVLATAAGRTVYTLSGATRRHPKCTRRHGCLRVWRPVTVRPGVKPTMPTNVPGRLGVLRRKGFRQITLNGRPLYTFAGDTAAGEATGQGIRSFGGTWRVIRTPAALVAPAPTPTPAPSPPTLYH
jgi:predicted lipoprotein with Yx(FWY)xxD motif